MEKVKAIGFDLFNTLITTDRQALGEGMKRLVTSLNMNSISVEEEPFKKAHRESAIDFLEKARRDGKETHNRFWISAALGMLGINIPPEHPVISRAVEDYFSGLLDGCRVLPGTLEMLETLRCSFGLGMLSNFTHAPAAHALIDRLGLTPMFDVILISGDLGFRKPHRSVFENLIRRLGTEREYILYVGDDPEPDILGARNAGIRPVWTTYVKDNNVATSPGMLTGNVDQPGFDVPRISSWEEFLSLLEIPDPSAIHGGAKDYKEDKPC